MTSELFKVNIALDDSAFLRLFGGAQKQLNKHEQSILELQRLLQDRVGRQELEKVQNDFRLELDKLRAELRQDFTQLKTETKADREAVQTDNRGQLDHVKEDFQRNLDTLKEANQQAVADQISRLEELESRDAGLAARLQSIEEAATSVGQNWQELQTYIQFMATSYGRLNDTDIEVNPDMEKKVNAVADKVNNQFAMLFHAMSKHQTDIIKLCEACGIEAESAGIFQNGQFAIPGSGSGFGMGMGIDLSELEPKPPLAVAWPEPPILPVTPKFESVNDSVAYLYDLCPAIQGHLSALHGQVLLNSEELSTTVDRNTLDPFLDKLRQAIIDIDEELSEMRAGIEANLTRPEVLQMIEKAFRDNENETAAGSMRCLACGQTSRHVAGATIEPDTVRRLGVPTNTLALMSILGGNRIGPLYSGPEQLESAIEEAPRSMRRGQSPAKVIKPLSKLPPKHAGTE
jgi:hypothetical protein